MVSKTIQINTIRPYLYSISRKVGLANLAVGLLCLAGFMVLARDHASGFFIGFTIGMASLYYSMKILRKGITREADKAARYGTNR